LRLQFANQRLKCHELLVQDTSIVRKLQTLRRAGVAMWFRSLALALLLLAAPALAGVEEKVAALAPQGLVLVMGAKGNELVAQNTDEPFVPASVTKIVTAWLAMEVSLSET
jgi:D-alanyl-D-alanine carboxypeptidase/D-alanyl-D-alanine-endopeptidase (penicillin-binding protein 4)